MSDIVCRFCGGNCSNEEENSLYLCDGYAGDIDGLYAKESDATEIEKLCPDHNMEFYEIEEDGEYFHGYECLTCGMLQTG